MEKAGPAKDVMPIALANAQRATFSARWRERVTM
jgi:hypothetical protein